MVGWIALKSGAYVELAPFEDELGDDEGPEDLERREMR